MMRHVFTFMILLAGGMATAPAWAQSPSCADQVKKLQSSPVLGVQGGTFQQETGRENAKVYLDEAARAAAQNNEQACQENLQRAQLALTY